MKMSILFFACISMAIYGCAHNKTVPQTTEVQYSYDGKAPFINPDSVKEDVLAECNVNLDLTSALYKRAKHYGISLINGSDHSRRLAIHIVSVEPGVNVFGNFLSVPAQLNVKFQVKEGENIVYEKYRECSTKLAGKLGLQPTACNKLKKCAENQAEFIARTLRKLP